jgi:stage II sporulation SpoE-like protein
MIKRLSLLLLLLAQFLCGFARAQSFDLTNGRVPLASLDGLWRFHTGDNPAWADPKFDDSQWPLLRSDKDWFEQGYNGYSGAAWYRFQLIVPAGLDRTSLLLSEIPASYEVYADGQLIGAYGRMPPRPVVYIGGGPQVFNLLPTIPSARSIEIAIRVWQSQGSAPLGGGYGFGGGLIGDPSQIESLRSSRQARSLWNDGAEEVLAPLQTLACLGAVLLFLLRRKEPEYLWFGLAMLFNSAAYWIRATSLNVVWPVPLLLAANAALDTASFIAFPMFYRQLLKPWGPRLLGFSLAAVGAQFLILEAYCLTGRVELLPFSLVAFLFGIPIATWMLLILISKARQGSPDARLLLLPHIPWTANFLVGSAAYITAQLGWQHSFTGSFILLTKPFPIRLDAVVQALFPLAVFGILVLRFTRTRSEEERYAGEVQAARNVQQYLIPEHLPNTPGLAIESEYRPAKEVGGDFFQVLPQTADGSVLIIVGDVAGHGMEAGMLATLIVGAIRTAAEFTTEPGSILTLLNKRMQGRGLATCLALRIERDGSAALANAGHLPPYLNGRELAMEGALPLGAIAGIEFPVLHFKLAESDTLMLMTDGVAEAQDAKGQLFGFDRIGEMLRTGVAAAALASAAQAFGQEDDITVLTVARGTAGASA